MEVERDEPGHTSAAAQQTGHSEHDALPLSELRLLTLNCLLPHGTSGEIG